MHSVFRTPFQDNTYYCTYKSTCPRSVFSA